MNKVLLVGLFHDWQLSARLAKISTQYSYDLKFINSINELLDLEFNGIIIIDIDKLNEYEINKIVKVKCGGAIFILGYTKVINKTKISQIMKKSYDMVLPHDQLLRNLNTIISKIINASRINK